MNKEIKREFILIFMGLLWLSCEKKVAAPAMPPAPAAAPKPTLEVAIAMGKPCSFIPSAKYEKNSLSISGQYLSGPIATDPLYEDIKFGFYAKNSVFFEIKGPPKTPLFDFFRRNFDIFHRFWLWRTISKCF